MKFKPKFKIGDVVVFRPGIYDEFFCFFRGKVIALPLSEFDVYTIEYINKQKLEKFIGDRFEEFIGDRFEEHELIKYELINCPEYLK